MSEEGSLDETERVGPAAARRVAGRHVQPDPGRRTMSESPWSRRILIAFVAAALYAGVFADWWLPRGFPG